MRSLESESSFFGRVRQELQEWSVPMRGTYPPLFAELLRRFEEAVGRIAARGAKEGDVSKASEYLREIVFLDSCLDAELRRDVGARLLATWVLNREKAGDKRLNPLLRIFETAPAADFFLAYALAWSSGEFDTPNAAPHTSAGKKALKVISLHSVKGGNGKSFLSQFWGRACASEGMKTVVVDLDFTGPTLQFLGGQTEARCAAKRSRAFPLFFKEPLPLLAAVADKVRPSHANETPEGLGRTLISVLEEKSSMRLHYLPFQVDSFNPKEKEDGEAARQDWRSCLKAYLRPTGTSGSDGGGLFYLPLPHRPEFLRRAGRLLEVPSFSGWRLVRAWLEWLLAELRRKRFDAVILDNAPGISNTWVIMRLIWALDAKLSACDRAVCVVSSPRVPDLANTAYELLWIQAADWTQSASIEFQRKVYWVGNMWDPEAPKLEDMVRSGNFPFLTSSDPSNVQTGQASRAAHLAGLTEMDIHRISFAIKAAGKRDRLAACQVDYREDLRRFFDFDHRNDQSSELQALNGVADDLKKVEPLKTLLRK